MDKRFVTFRLGEERFGFPVEEVREVAEPIPTTKVPKAPPYVEGIANLRGRVVPVLNLRKRLKISGEGGERGVVLAQIGERLVGFLVDEVEGLSNVPEESIGPPTNLLESKVDATYLRGVGETEEGRIVLLDPERILETDQAK